MYVLLDSRFYVEKMSNNDIACLWHRILGHVNMTKLKLRVHKELVKGLPKLSIDNGRIL